MACTSVLVSLFLLAPCDETPGGMQTISSSLANPLRPAADLARDENRNPLKVLSFLEIEPGMTVLEMFAGGGYYTQILDGVVGQKGQVIAHNNQGFLNYVGDEFKGRFEDGGLPHTRTMVGEAADLDLEANSLDAVLLMLIWHDFLYANEEYQWPDVDESKLVVELCTAMKPGAVLGIVDHVAQPGGDAGVIAETLHRVDPELVRASLQDSCFELTMTTGLLHNPDDDHTTSAIGGPMLGKTDRFVFKYVRKDET